VLLAATVGFMIGSACTLLLSNTVDLERNVFGASPPVLAANNLKTAADFDAVWPDLQSRLCPNMKPEAALGEALFRLARSELGMDTYDAYNPASKTTTDNALRASAWDAHTFNPQPWSYSPNETPVKKGLHSVSLPLHGPRARNPQKKRRLNEANDTAMGDMSGGTVVCLRIYKAANDQIRTWARLEFAKPNKRGMGRYRDVDAMERLQRKNAWKDACVVTAVRDPIERFMSGYNEIEIRWSRGIIRDQNQGGSIAPVYKYERGGNGTKGRFEQFVAEYVSSDTEREGWDWKSLELEHIWSMSGVLYDLNQSGGHMADYLPSLSNLTYDWPQFLQSTCPTIEQDIARRPMAIRGQHGSSRDRHGYYAAAKLVWAGGGATARALCVLNVMDYACWGKLPAGVPPLCKEVYSRPRFTSAIFDAVSANKV